MPSVSPPRNLRELLRAEPRLAPERAARLLGDLAGALGAWHARGAAHGALTPERVLLDADGRATLAPPPADEAGTPAPWPAYLAPEQIDGRPAEPHSDVYVLGLLGWEMLAGQQPWAGESLYGVVLKQREQDLPRLSTLRPGLPRPLVQAIEGALHKHPADRWRGSDEMLSELRAGDVTIFGERLPPSAHPISAAEAAFGSRHPAAAPERPPVGEPVRRSSVGDAAAIGSHGLGPAGLADAAAPRMRRGAPPAGEPTVAIPVPGGAAADALTPPRRRDAAASDRQADAERTAALAAERAAAVSPPPARSRMRPLTLAALVLAVLGAGVAGLAVVQGRYERSETAAWLDSVSSGSAGEVVAESTLDAAAARVRAERERTERARRAQQAAAARRDSIARLEAAQADSIAAGTLAPATPPAPDSAAPPPAPTPPDSLGRR